MSLPAVWPAIPLCGGSAAYGLTALLPGPGSTFTCSACRRWADTCHPTCYVCGCCQKPKWQHRKVPAVVRCCRSHLPAACLLSVCSDRLAAGQSNCASPTIISLTQQLPVRACCVFLRLCCDAAQQCGAPPCRLAAV